MTISAIGFQNASIHIASSSASSVASSSDSSAAAKSDSVTLSAQSLALLQQSQSSQSAGGHHHHHQLTDDQAAKVGDQISQKDPALFKQLDQDGDGKLSASELQDGIKQLREQRQQESSTTSAGDAASTSGDAADELDVIKQAFAAVLGHGKHPDAPPAAAAGDAEAEAAGVSSSST